METLTAFSVAAFFASVDRKDVDGFSAFLTEDASFRFGNYPAWEGRETIRQSTVAIFDSVASLSHSDVKVYHCDEQDVIIANGVVTYNRHDGVSKSYPFACTYHMDDQQISKYLVFVDNHDLFD